MLVARTVKRKVKTVNLGSLKKAEQIEVTVLIREKFDICDDPEAISTDLEIVSSEFVSDGLVVTLLLTTQVAPGSQTSIFQLGGFKVELIANVTSAVHVCREGIRYVPKTGKKDVDERAVEL